MRFKGLIGWSTSAQVLVIASVLLTACATGLNMGSSDPEADGDDAIGQAGSGGATSASSSAGSGGATSTSSSASSSAGSGGATSTSSSASSSTSASSSSSSATTGSGGSGPASSSVTTGGGPVSYVELKYLVNNASAAEAQPVFKFILFNNSATSIPLSELTVRYWFTSDGASTPLNFVSDYSAIPGGTGNLVSTFGTASGTMADHYLEIGFLPGAGYLAASGGSSGETQVRIHTDSFEVFDQTDDYSFDATKTSFQDWEHITVYSSGRLVWGTEP